MENDLKDRELLYDPMFAKKPVLDWEDSANGKFFGKAKVKKTLFIFVLLISIAASLYFSFSSLSKAKFEYEASGDGWKLNAFHGQKYDTVLGIDYVRGEDNVPDEEKPVVAVREFTSTGNDTLQFIFIGKDVKEIEKTAFFYCTSLNAIFVDPENENFTAIDGILYRKENGVPVEAVICPQNRTRYIYAVNHGEKVPVTQEDAAKLAEKFADEDYANALAEKIKDENVTDGKTVELPGTVTVIGQLCFAYCDRLTSVTLPKGLKTIETMAFFKCSALTGIDLPDGLEVIGSDAFTKCGKIDYIYIPATVKEIGHHAFSECNAAEKVYMAAENLDGVNTGSDWLPQYRKTFMKDRDIAFGAERGVK